MCSSMCEPDVRICVHLNVLELAECLEKYTICIDVSEHASSPVVCRGWVFTFLGQNFEQRLVISPLVDSIELFSSARK